MKGSGSCVGSASSTRARERSARASADRRRPRPGGVSTGGALRFWFLQPCGAGWEDVSAFASPPGAMHMLVATSSVFWPKGGGEGFAPRLIWWRKSRRPSGGPCLGWCTIARAAVPRGRSLRGKRAKPLPAGNAGAYPQRRILAPGPLEGDDGGLIEKPQGGTP